jgi:hypothetical protein
MDFDADSVAIGELAYARVVVGGDMRGSTEKLDVYDG